MKVLVDLDDYIKAKKAKLALGFLEVGGVDNWSWYGDSLNPDGEKSYEETAKDLEADIREWAAQQPVPNFPVKRESPTPGPAGLTCARAIVTLNGHWNLADAKEVIEEALKKYDVTGFTVEEA